MRFELRPPWLLLGGLTTILVAAIASRPALVTRVAIRVDCTQPKACERAEAVALDVWSEHRAPGMPLDVVVSSRDLPRLAHYEVLVRDIDAVARAERVRLSRAQAAQPADWFGDYKDYRAVSERMIELAALDPERVQIHGIGSSLDGRTIWALRIGNGDTKMLVNGTQHAREWIATMVTTCVADRLVREYHTNPAIKAFVDRTTLWVIPVVNPDGYQHSWATDRYWRKNRRGKHGVDLNRNFSIGFGGTGSSGSKLAQDYRGEYAFSEPESAAIRDLAKRERVALHIDFHAYGQLLLYPWNYSARRTDDHARFTAVGDRIASALTAQHGSRYKLMQGTELYPAAGTATDWFYGDGKAMSFTVELRPTMGRGGGGFVLPPEQIRPTCDEGLAAVLALRDAR